MLHEKTQRRLFRALFILGCLLPTLAIAGWAFARFHPAFKTMMLAEIGQQAGVHLACKQIQTPRPGVYKIIQLEIRDRHTERLIGRIDQLTAQKADDIWQMVASNVWIEQPAGTVTSSESFRLADIPRTFNASINSLTIGKAEQSLGNWQRVKIGFQHEPASTDSQDDAQSNSPTPTLSITSHTATGEPNTQIKLSQTFIKDQLVTLIDLNTGSTPIRGELIPLENASLQKLLNGGTFLGTCQAMITGRKSEGEVRGTMELAKGNAGPEYGSWSRATIELQKVKWKGIFPHQLKAEIDVRDGTLGRQLVLGLGNHLNCHVSDTLKELWQDETLEAIPFDQLACEIEFDDRGLILVGKCKNLSGENTSGKLAYSLLARNNESLLRQPEERLLSLLNVLQAFGPMALPAAQ